MSKSSKRSSESAGADQVPAAPVPLTPHEQWSGSHDDLPTVQEVVEGMGFTLLGSVDAPAPLMIPAPLFAKIQAADREMAACAARRQEYLELAIDLLGIDRTLQHPTVNLDTGLVTISPLEAAPL